MGRFPPRRGHNRRDKRATLIRRKARKTAKLSKGFGRTRRLATLIEQKMVESGGQVAYVYARGTSSWAFDGSGRVTRDKAQYELATFPNGKRYNADLNASYNIGARYWAWKHKLTRRKNGQLPAGRSSPGKPRMPVTLSTLWQREPEAPHRCAA